MPAAVRLGDISKGHPPFPPRANDTASPNVFVNGIAWHRQSDHWLVHCAGPNCHDGVLVSGSPNVFVNNKQAGRRNDPISCGDTTLQASPNVFANGS